MLENIAVGVILFSPFFLFALVLGLLRRAGVRTE